MPSQAIYMIILNFKKSNTNFENILDFYQNLNNFGALVCPYCHSSNLIRCGSYSRNVIFFNHSNCLRSKIIKVQRVKCKGCNKTHALLPLGIIPYKQFSSPVITTILSASTVSSLSSLSHKYKLDFNIIQKWIHDFNSKHRSRLVALLQTTNLSFLLSTFLSNLSYQLDYLFRYHVCFMQIKRAFIGVCPS